MAWMALAALPSVIQMMQPKPSAPSNPAANIKLPDMSNWQNQLLNSGFNPQSDLYKIASQQSMGSVNADLANKGLGFSSYGNQATSAAQVQLANTFLQHELERRIQAFQAASGYNLQAANQQFNAANAGYQSAMNQYGAQVNGNQQDIGNISNMINTGIGAYSGYQANQNAQQLQTQNQNNFNTYMNYLNSANSGGPTGGSTMMSPGLPMLPMKNQSNSGTM